MSAPIAIFHHSVFCAPDGSLWPAAPAIIASQMDALRRSGILDFASVVVCGINGGSESRCLASALLPPQARLIYHGLESRNENSTLAALEDWLPRHRHYHVLYHHAKGATHTPGERKGTIWRNCMTRHLIKNWRRCVTDLDAGHEVVGCHFMRPPLTPGNQHIFAGNWWFAKASFLATLPSIRSTARVKLSGLGALDSRYEAETWIGNGPRLPRIKDYHGPSWHPGFIDSCI